MTAEQAQSNRKYIDAFINKTAIVESVWPNNDWREVDSLFQIDRDPSKNRFKTKPVMIPLGPEDFGPVTWIRSGHEDMVIIGVRPGGVRVGHSWYSYESLQTSDWLYSTDRKTWKRCEKEAV